MDTDVFDPCGCSRRNLVRNSCLDRAHVDKQTAAFHERSRFYRNTLSLSYRHGDDDYVRFSRVQYRSREDSHLIRGLLGILERATRDLDLGSLQRGESGEKAAHSASSTHHKEPQSLESRSLFHVGSGLRLYAHFENLSKDAL